LDEITTVLNIKFLLVICSTLNKFVVYKNLIINLLKIINTIKSLMFKIYVSFCLIIESCLLTHIHLYFILRIVLS